LSPRYLGLTVPSRPGGNTGPLFFGACQSRPHAMSALASNFFVVFKHIERS
jgi:hypothetical protein